MNIQFVPHRNNNVLQSVRKIGECCVEKQLFIVTTAWTQAVWTKCTVFSFILCGK